MNAPERPTQAETKPVAVNARRKLIRGAFALPAVAAVHSGSALANSSSLRCLTNGLAGDQAPAVIQLNQPDTNPYLRIPLAVTSRVNPNSNSGNVQYRYYVSFDDVNDAATARHVGILPNFISSNRFKQFDPSINEITATGNGQKLKAIQQNDWLLVQNRSALPVANQLFAVLIFNPEGTLIVGVGRTTGTGRVATGSCWNSFGTNL